MDGMGGGGGGWVEVLPTQIYQMLYLLICMVGGGGGCGVVEHRD